MATAMEPAPAMPIDQLIIEEHNKVKFLANEYLKAATLDMKEQLALTISREVSMHASKEESLIYPLIGQLFGKEAQEHCVAEHQSMKEKLTQLLNMNIQDNEDAYDAMMLAISNEFNQHTVEEEQREIPRLLQGPGVDLIQLGMQWQQAAATAMTKPLPNAPDKQPMAAMQKLMTMPPDEVINMMQAGTMGGQGMQPMQA